MTALPELCKKVAFRFEIVDKWILCFYNRVSTRRRGPKGDHAALCFFCIRVKARPAGERLEPPGCSKKSKTKEGKFMDQLVQHQQTINDQLARYGVKLTAPGLKMRWM